MKKTLSIEPVAADYDRARAYTRIHARSFYFASHVLPEVKRNDAYAVYAFCRLADNIVDEGRSDLPVLLGLLKDELDAVYSRGGHPGLAAFRETIDRCEIPKEYFLDLFRGLEMDLVRNRYHDFAELEDYCYCVASVVGLIMAKVFGVTNESALRHARDLGTAMQLTNILRDIGEDAERGRLYLPGTELNEFGVTEEQVFSSTVTREFRELMAFQVDRARRFYRSGEQGFSFIPDDGSRYCVRLMSGTYGRILKRIEKQDYDVFRRRAAVPFWEKLLIAAKPPLHGNVLNQESVQ